MTVIERTDKDLEDETKELFQSIKPYLDDGVSFTRALINVGKGRNTRSRWYRDIREYTIQQGYEIKKSARNPDYGE